LLKLHRCSRRGGCERQPASWFPGTWLTPLCWQWKLYTAPVLLPCTWWSAACRKPAVVWLRLKPVKGVAVGGFQRAVCGC